MIHKKKIYIALIPFLVTTIGISMFLVFFNFGTITFNGQGPFQVLYNDSSVTDINGTVALTLRAQEYDFKITSEDYFGQDVHQTIRWRDNIQVPVSLVYKPIATQQDALLPFRYEDNRVIVDNQRTDLFFSIVPPKSLTGIPSGYTRIVWAKDGESACLFAPQDPNIVPQYWHSTKGFSAMMLTTFNCFATDRELIPVKIENKKLIINNKVVDEVSGDFNVEISPSGEYAVISLNETQNTTIHIVNLLNEKRTTFSTTHPLEPPRFIGKNTLGIRRNGIIDIYTAPFDSPPQNFVVQANILSLAAIAYSEKLATTYVIKRHEPPQTLWSDLETTNESQPYELWLHHKGLEYLAYTFTAGEDITYLLIDTHEKTLAALNKDGNKATTFRLVP